MTASAIFFILLLWQSLSLPSDCAVQGKKNDSTSAKNPYMCLQGSPGLPGRNGANGHNGLPGTPGTAGTPGSPGSPGTPGTAGRDGRDGAKGDKGVAGPPGSRGVKGDAGQNGADADHRNWKQCAWKNQDNRDIGLIKDCEFTKNKDDSALRVVYQGDLYLGSCNTCCKRWFITLNGAECSVPMPIDAIIWIRKSDQDNHRHGAIEGFCENIHKGKVRVGINIGNCPGYGNSDGVTGWNSVSRLIIEEVPRSQ